MAWVPEPSPGQRRRNQMPGIENHEPEKEMERKEPVWLKENQQCMVTGGKRRVSRRVLLTQKANDGFGNKEVIGDHDESCFSGVGRTTSQLEQVGDKMGDE